MVGTPGGTPDPTGNGGPAAATPDATATPDAPTGVAPTPTTVDEPAANPSFGLTPDALGERSADTAFTPNALGSPVGVPAASPISELFDDREVVPWPIILAAIGVVLAFGAAIQLVVALQRVLELLVISGFLALVLSPAVSLLVRLKMRRGMATAIVFLLGMATFGGLGYLFIHPLYREAISFADDLPGLLAKTEAGKGQLGSLIAKYNLQDTAATEIPKIRDYLSHLGGPALTVAKRVLSGLGGLVVLSTLVFLMLLEGPTVVHGVLRVLPPRRARRMRRILDDVAKSVTGYVVGNVATSCIAGLICGITLSLLGVPFPIVFGVWVALVDFIPLVGGLLAGVPTVAFAALRSPTAGIITLIVFLVYQQLENHLLNPIIMSKTVKLNPLWVILSVLAGAQLAGFVGALLAIPAAGAIHVIGRDIWDERRGRLKRIPTEGPDETPIA